jgi:sialic acid synthase SpsE
VSTFVIAELAGTHDRHFLRAWGLAVQCLDAGADAIKLQYWSDAAKEAARVNAPELVALFRRVQTPVEWLPTFADLAHGRGKEFLCTVELPEDIAVVAPYVDRFKIASTSSRDQAFIAAHRRYGKPILVSHGMGAAPRSLPQVQNLHCVSGYPTPPEEANLRLIRESWMAEGGPPMPPPRTYAGFSDHTAHVLTGAFAVCAGAEILEVHVRADDTPPDNPDYGHSLTPAQFREYVAHVRLAERMLGDGVKRIMPSEEPNLRYRVTA